MRLDSALMTVSILLVRPIQKASRIPITSCSRTWNMGAIASLPAFTAPTNATLLGTLRWSSAQQGAVLALAGLSLTYCLNRLAIRTVTTRRSLPPSLPGWPIIGNALDMPTTDLAQSYRKLAKELSELP